MKLNNESADNPKIIVDLFAKHFESVYAPIDSNTSTNEYNCNCEKHFNISEEMIMNVIKPMNENKVNSPDNIPTVFYKRTIYSIVKPLKIIFNNSIHKRLLPAK